MLSVTTAFVGDSEVFPVDGGVQVDLLVLKPSDYADLEPDYRIPAYVNWKLAQSAIWQWWRRRKLTISKRDYRALVGENGTE